MERLFWAMPLVLFALFAAAETTKGEREELVEVDSIEDSELPKVVEVTEAVKVRLVGGAGRVATLELPKGAKVEVTGRDGNLLKILFAKSAGQIDISKTTAVAQVAEIRAAEHRARLARAEVHSAEVERKHQEREMERLARRDILVHSWTWRQTRGGNYYEAVGEIENESGRALENVQVEITIRDASGNIVSTETALTNDRDLQPGQRTTFSVMNRRVGGEQTASLAFRKFWGDRYTHREK